MAEFDMYEMTTIRPKNVINMDRKGTDTSFALIFFAFVILWIIIDIWGYSAGNLYRINGPVDTGGNFCGISNGYEEHKYLYFIDPTNSTTQL